MSWLAETLRQYPEIAGGIAKDGVPQALFSVVRCVLCIATLIEEIQIGTARRPSPRLQTGPAEAGFLFHPGRDGLRPVPFFRPS